MRSIVADRSTALGRGTRPRIVRTPPAPGACGRTGSAPPASVAGIVVRGSWARPLIVVSGVASALMLAIDSGPLAVPGLAIDAVLVCIAVATPSAVSTVL